MIFFLQLTPCKLYVVTLNEGLLFILHLSSILFQVWGHRSDDILEFHKSHNHQDRISYIVENDLIIDAVSQKIKSLNIDVVYETKVAQYSLPNQSMENVNIQFESGESVDCKLLLGTDGARSQVRQAMNVQYISWDYDSRGIVATVKVSTPSPNTTAWQR